MFNELFYYAGALTSAFARGTDMPSLREARIANAADRAFRIARAVGRPRLRPAALPTLQSWTVAQLRAEASRRRIRGRSKARTKAQLLQLLSSGRAGQPAMSDALIDARPARRIRDNSSQK